MIRIFLILVLLVFASCTDSLYEISEGSNLTQDVYLLPDGFNGDYTVALTPLSTAVAEQGQSARFVASYSKDGEHLSNDSASKYYKSLFWEIDGEYFNIDVFRYTFKKSGVIEGRLSTIDYFDDTLTHSFQIYVNTPEHILLEFPYDGYNQAEPTSIEAHPFRWTMTGIDPWETAQCSIYLSMDLDSLWDSMIGSTDCSNDATLWGALVGDSSTFWQDNLNPYIKSYTFYWAIQYTISINGSKKYSEKSDIHYFSTKILNENYSRLTIPINYQGYDSTGSVRTRFDIVNSTGDTLNYFFRTNPNTSYTFNIKPQSGLKIYISEQNKLDYTAESLFVDLPPNTEVVSDTIYLKDNTPPQLAPVSTYFHDNLQDMEFNLYDDGSGINESKLKVFVGSEPREITFKKNLLSFSPQCPKECKVFIQGEDNARNKLPDIYWVIQRESSGFINVKGPFRNQEES